LYLWVKLAKLERETLHAKYTLCHVHFYKSKYNGALYYVPQLLLWFESALPLQGLCVKAWFLVRGAIGGRVEPLRGGT
jgi:hypothetical protein